MAAMVNTQSSVPPVLVPLKYPFWLGGSASSMAVFLTHPLELVMYGTTRFGLYEVFKTHRQNRTQQAPTLSTLIPVAAFSGFVGGIVGSPADLTNVRMQSDFGLPTASRRHYRNLFDAWFRMGREEGWQYFTRALWPNAVRAALMNSSQLASYDGFKTVLTQHLSLVDGTPTQFIASTLASLVATTACSPVDVLKTRMMSSSKRIPVVSLIFDMSRTEGLAWVFRGWLPGFVRLGPQTIATLLLLEQHKKIYRLLQTSA